ncbi:MAG: flagellar assembly peptidoglycan hydrolase FlgJ [Pseudomonadota bacterium]
MTSVTDFGQFTDLRALAGRDRDAALNKVAGQFEALFVQEMLKSMRAASFGDPIFGEAGGGGMYRDLFDQQIADDIASGTGVGLKDLLVRQLGGDPGARHTPPPPAGSLAPTPVARSSRVAAAVATTRSPALTTGAPAVAASAPTPENWTDPQSFIKDILPHARAVADTLGVSPLGVLAQAALETGWGQHVMPGEGGQSSLNLFGIKAGRGWQGTAVQRDTLEFEDGAMRQRREAFRAYPSLNQSFADYGALIGGSERYAGVRNRANDVSGFAEALQRSGYATDPNYAAKIRRVASGDTMRGVLDALKQTDLLSLSTHVR